MILKTKSMTRMKAKKILIIDFEKRSLISLAKFVQAEGYEVIIATDGLTGLDKFKSENPDLVIMEAMLPKLHGFDLCLKINCDFPRKVPIIIITGVYRESLYKSEALQFYGASAYFEKPWKREELRSTILNLLSKQEENEVQEEQPQATGSMQELFQKRQELKMEKDFKRKSPKNLETEEIEKEEREERKRRAEIEQEVEMMLKTTLADLGLEFDFKKKKSVIEPETELEPEPELELETELEQPEPEPETELELETKLEPEPEPEHEVEPEIELEQPEQEEHEQKEIKEIKERIPRKTEKILFAEYPKEKKKRSSSFPVISLIVFIAIVSVATLIFFHSKKSDLSPNGTFPSSSEALQMELPEKQNTKQASQALQKEEPKTEMDKNSLPEPSKVDLASKETQPVTPPENIEPLLPPEIPPLKIQQTQENKALAPQVEAEEVSLPEEEINPPQEPKAEEQLEASNSPQEVIKTGDLIPLSLVDTPPEPVKKVNPLYPSLAFTMGIEGTVIVNALISENGDVLKIQVIKRIEGVENSFGLERASENAVKQWKFQPAIKDGVKVKVWKPIAIAFKKK